MYYQKNKEKTTKKAYKRYQNSFKEEKWKKQQYGCESYKNLLEDDKQKLVEYRKKYKMRKKKLYYTYKKHLFYEINFEAINLNLKKKS